MLGMIDTATVTVSINGVELLALKKLSLVSHALAQQIGGPSGKEQHSLADVLDKLVRQIEINGHLS